jgi:hypothetical protein
MGTLGAIAKEILHLFVDDGSLALALVVWCAAVGVAVVLLPSPVPAAGPALFLGCAAILLLNVVRTVRARAGAARQP